MCEYDRSRDGFCSIVQNPAFVSGNLNSAYCRVTLAKFVIVSDHDHFMLGLRKVRENNRDRNHVLDNRIRHVVDNYFHIFSDNVVRSR